MESSIALVADYLEELGTSVTRGEPIGRQVSVARRAERRMLAKLGSNTHKGAIFICGILVMARYRTDCDDEGALRCAVSRVARQVAAAGAPGPGLDSRGGRVLPVGHRVPGRERGPG